MPYLSEKALRLAEYEDVLEEETVDPWINILFASYVRIGLISSFWNYTILSSIFGEI